MTKRQTYTPLRSHRKKFMRNKRVSAYSSKDLNDILGIRQPPQAQDTSAEKEVVEKVVKQA
jgi:hypothetical protein